MNKQLTIQDLITLRRGLFGKMWLACVQDPEKAAHMVDSIVDFMDESMKVAYQFGLESKNTIELLKKR